MKIRYFRYMIALNMILGLGFGLVLSGTAGAEDVEWQGPSGSKIKEIRYFRKAAQDESQQTLLAAPPAGTTSTATAGTVSNVIDSPPVDGFVPWIVVAPTDEALDAETTGIYDSIPSSYYIGDPPSGTDPQTDYFIGLFDTGASSHVIGYENAVRAGLYNSIYLTEKNYVTVTGVTGSVDAHVTMPYALFMDGLDALEPNQPGESEMILPTIAGMVGEYNVSTLIGKNPGSNPDLATAIGTPMSVFYDTQIEVDQPITVVHDGTEYTAPRITFYEKGSSSPSYANYIPLELKPAGSTTVQYITYGIDFEDWLDDPFSFEFDYSPLTPSVVIGTSSQSLFFIHGVDLSEGSRTAQDKNRFMLDTGAQVTVIGSRIAARLGLHPDNKEFEVDIEGVSGDVVQVPGFYVDSLSIPGMGQWLEYTNVPVILLDIASPEGGTLDGIIGMNLFTEYNLILRAGGFMLEDDPRLEFERIAGDLVTGDIAPQPVDGKVDLLDYSVFSASWMATDADANWNADADFVSTGSSEGVINLDDLSVFAQNWLNGL